MVAYNVEGEVGSVRNDGLALEVLAILLFRHDGTLRDSGAVEKIESLGVKSLLEVHIRLAA